MSEKDLKIAKQIKKELKAKLGDKLISVILYGSRARGDFHDESDMDLLILTSENNSQVRTKINDIIYNYEYKNDFQMLISSKIYNIQQYNKRNNPKTSFFYSLHQDAIKI